jgi:small subunit ribosomal protein S6
MAKNKKSEIPHYEMLYIVPNKFSEDELKPIVENINQTIKKQGGEITHEETWGKKRLAYPINHNNYGYYQLVEFDLEGKKLSKLNDLIRMSAEILRHQIVVKKKLSEEEIQKAKESQKKQAEKKEEKKIEEEKIKTEEKKGSVKLKDLDEKLDKILDTNDLL